MAAHPRSRDLDRDLVEQLEFLASSCETFDRGALAEAKRIAVAIRVLVHDTRMSHSLLQQIGIKTKLDWADSAPVMSDDPNIVGRSPGLTGMGIGQGGMIYTPRSSTGIKESSMTRYVDFEEWWTRKVIVDTNDAPFTRRALILALANKDGGAHIDQLDEDVYALVHENSTGFIRFGPGRDAGEAMPSPIYASARTIAEELFVTLDRAGHSAMERLTVPLSTPATGGVDFFQAGAIAEPASKPVEVESLPGIAQASFKFKDLTAVTFNVTRTAADHYDPVSKTTLPGGWLQIVGVRENDGAIVHQSGFAGPTSATVSGLPRSSKRPAASVATPGSVNFAFDNFAEALFSATRLQQTQSVEEHGLTFIQEKGTIALFLTIGDDAWQIGGFQGPAE